MVTQIVAPTAPVMTSQGTQTDPEMGDRFLIDKLEKEISSLWDKVQDLKEENSILRAISSGYITESKLQKKWIDAMKKNTFRLHDVIRSMVTAHRHELEAGDAVTRVSLDLLCETYDTDAFLVKKFARKRGDSPTTSEDTTSR